jgi:HPt (histidine-containing phosphotransfer) domain-containing protein
VKENAAPRSDIGPVPVVDLDHLHGFTDGDLALEQELGELYMSSACLYVERLRASLDVPEAWQRAAHALKGASANLGARRVAEHALAAEHAPPDETALIELERLVGEVRAFFAGRGG